MPGPQQQEGRQELEKLNSLFDKYSGDSFEVNAFQLAKILTEALAGGWLSD